MSEQARNSFPASFLNVFNSARRQSPPFCWCVGAVVGFGGGVGGGNGGSGGGEHLGSRFHYLRMEKVAIREIYGDGRGKKGVAGVVPSTIATSKAQLNDESARIGSSVIPLPQVYKKPEMFKHMMNKGGKKP